MINKSAVFSAMIVLGLGLSRCQHDPLTPLNDAPTISFSTDVLPIITSNCTESGCHGVDGRHQQIFTNYSEILNIISPGNPDNSKLFTVITSNAIGTMPQPPNPRLSDSEIKTIYVWILQGAKDN